MSESFLLCKFCVHWPCSVSPLSHVVKVSNVFNVFNSVSTRFLTGPRFCPLFHRPAGLFRAKPYLWPRKLGIIILLPPRPSVFTAALNHYQYSALHCSILHCTTISILSGRCVCKKSDRPWEGGWVGVVRWESRVAVRGQLRWEVMLQLRNQLRL